MPDGIQDGGQLPGLGFLTGQRPGRSDRAGSGCAPESIPILNASARRLPSAPSGSAGLPCWAQPEANCVTRPSPQFSASRKRVTGGRASLPWLVVSGGPAWATPASRHRGRRWCCGSQAARRVILPSSRHRHFPCRRLPVRPFHRQFRRPPPVIEMPEQPIGANGEHREQHDTGDDAPQHDDPGLAHDHMPPAGASQPRRLARTGAGVPLGGKLAVANYC